LAQADGSRASKEAPGSRSFDIVATMLSRFCIAPLLLLLLDLCAGAPAGDVMCSAFNGCGAGWALKPNAATIAGYDRAACCNRVSGEASEGTPQSRRAAEAPLDSSQSLAAPPPVAGRPSSLRAVSAKVAAVGSMSGKTGNKSMQAAQSGKSVMMKLQKVSSLARKKVQELKDKCNSNPCKFCVFFANYNSPAKSKCVCRNALPEPEPDLGAQSVGIAQTGPERCEQGKTIGGTFLDAAGILLGVIGTWAAFPLPVSGAVAWAIAASIPDVFAIPLGYLTCNKNELLIEESARTKALIGEYFQTASLETATHFLNKAQRQIYRYTKNNRTIPLYELQGVISSMQDAQIHAVGAKALGAELVAQIGEYLAAQITRKVQRVERRNCDPAIEEYVQALETTIEFVEDIKVEFEGNFADSVNCGARCGGGGCFCFFCGNQRTTAVCASSLNMPQYNFQLNGLQHGDYACTRCNGHDQTHHLNLARNRARDAWTQEVNTWWARVFPYYNQTQYLLGQTESVRNMCGQQCGPNIIVGGVRVGQSCECGGLPFCDLDVGRCVSERPVAQASRQYDCPTQFT